jgi:hypothetical protein
MEPDVIRRTRVTPSRQRATVVASVTLVFLVLAAACGGSGDADADSGNADTSAVIADKYVPEVDEGLGASIAIVIDHSGSMKEEAKGDSRPKFVVAREALEAMLAATDSFVARNPDFPINVGLYRFSSRVTQMAPVTRFDREKLQAALDAMPEPDGGTAIGTAMDSARAGLYRAGTFRKYILVVTDGENTDGPSPGDVMTALSKRPEAERPSVYFVAFDISASRFDGVRNAGGLVLEAADAEGLNKTLDFLLTGKILVEQ